MFKTTQKLFILCLTILLPACGTIIGNGIWSDPTTPVTGSGNNIALNFSAPIDQYHQSSLNDCGSFTEQSSVATVDAGRNCIHNAFTACTESKYLYNKTNPDGSRFVSFVSVIEDQSNLGACKLYVHTVSNVPPPIGDVEKTCSTLEANELPEVACGIQ